MIKCTECGNIYDETLRMCPECGNPTGLTDPTPSDETPICPNCGAELHRTQDYKFVCDFCGTASPVDSRTKASIDKKRERERAQIRRIRSQTRQNRVKLHFLIIIWSIIATIVTMIVTSQCSAFFRH